MAANIAKFFIVTALFFFLVGCIEGIMFPTKFQFGDLYAAIFHIQPEHIKSFFGYFVAKIHTHVNLIGWVGSALMGILYFIAPQISGNERYTPWVAYGNWICQTLGILLIALGFHLIGIFGLSSGFAAGSPEFRSASAPYKMLVTVGGILVVISALLFACNMLRTLLAPAQAADAADKAGRVKSRMVLSKAAAVILTAVIGLSAAGPVRPAAASPAPVPDRVDVIMIGDRLVDVAHALGAVPAAMSVRCEMWPMCATLKSTSQVLGCPSCLSKKKAAPLFAFAERAGIQRVLIERSDPFCTYMPNVRLETFESLLQEKGLKVEFIDFTHGLDVAVRQAAKALGRLERAEAVLASYDKAMSQAKEKIAGRRYAGKVVIINGVYQAATGKTFLRIEAPGGYADRFLLSAMGSRNVGDACLAAKKSPSKGHYAIRKLDGLLRAAPDAIVMTGDAVAVQTAIAAALNEKPALMDVPAIKNHAIYSLPAYVDASVIEYPSILVRWADALAGF